MKQRLEITSAGGVVAAVLAVVVSSCCALPMALVFMGVGTGAVGLLGPLHRFRPLILLVAGGLLLAAWIMAIRRRASRAYPALGLGSALLVAAFMWTWWDPILESLVMRAAHP